MFTLIKVVFPYLTYLCVDMLAHWLNHMKEFQHLRTGKYYIFIMLKYSILIHSRSHLPHCWFELHFEQLMPAQYSHNCPHFIAPVIGHEMWPAALGTRYSKLRALLPFRDHACSIWYDITCYICYINILRTKNAILISRTCDKRT